MDISDNPARSDSGRGSRLGDDGSRAAYHDGLRLTTRRSALLAGLVLFVAFPLWSVFDLLVLPGRAPEFIAIRAGFELPIGLAVIALWHPRIGGRWPEATAFALLVLPQLAIAWMIPLSRPQLSAYLLGFSLIIFGSAVVVVWRWQLTIWLTIATFAATGVAIATVRPSLPTSALATIVFYLGTAGIVAIIGQLYRYRAGWEQFVTQAALERERERNDALVEELRALSGEDALTGVANRRAWEAWVLDPIRRAARSAAPFSLILCDFDRFKDINDCHGHAFGDEVLRSAAEALGAAVRSTDFVARLGGDEFVIGCPDTELGAATELAHRLAAAARDRCWPNDVVMTASFGVAQLAPTETDVDALLARADVALYEAKATRDAVVPAVDRSAPMVHGAHQYPTHA